MRFASVSGTGTVRAADATPYLYCICRGLGRARPLKTRGEAALGPIPPETWRDRTFIIVRPPGRRPHTWIAWSGVHGRPYTHSDVRVSSAQVDDLWPKLKDAGTETAPRADADP